MKKDAMMARALDYMLCIACGQRQGATNRLTAVTAERDRLLAALRLTETVLLDVARDWQGTSDRYTRLIDAFAVINSAMPPPRPCPRKRPYDHTSHDRR